MKKYFAVLRVKLLNGLQYRAAAFAGIVTQFAWGGLLIMLYRAFYAENAARFPMTMHQTASYIWMQQAFLALFMAWRVDREPFELIQSGNVAYELVRPASLYAVWFARNVGMRLAQAALRCVPVLAFSLLLPAPFGLIRPELSLKTLWFIVSLTLSMHVVVAYTMLQYAVTFKTLSSTGVAMVFQTLTDAFSGALVPLPFFPDAVRRVIEWTPFAVMQDVPLRIYSGSIAGADIYIALIKQAVWLALLVLAGVYSFRRATAKIVVQGG